MVQADFTVQAGPNRIPEETTEVSENSRVQPGRSSEKEEDGADEAACAL